MSKFFIDRYDNEPNELGPQMAVELSEEDLRCLHVAIMHFNQSKISTKPAVKKTLESIDKKLQLVKTYNKETK